MSALISTAELKAWLSIPLTDVSRDALLGSLATAASEAAIKVMQHNPVRSARTLLVDGYGGSGLPLNHFPIHSVEAVTINPDLGGQPLPPSAYTFDDHMIHLRHGVFPRGKRNVSISYTAGLAEVPEHIKTACQYIAKGMWDARKTDMNASGESFQGVGGASFWPSGPGAVPPQALSLLMLSYNPVRV
jgi:hypothetical protein